MAAGGKLTLAVANARVSESQAAQRSEATAGDYVMIAVTDTGDGMAAAVREKIFEPFFTTKEVGRGTGLGLSMVYGFVQQSGGHVTVYSEPGLGTTIKLYLPRSQATAGTDRETASEPTETANIETILVVEDDGDLRTLAVVVLSDLGYRVLEAGNAAQALRLVEHDSRIDLLLADVVLPDGIGGEALADALLARMPALKVLYMSGYPEAAMIRDGRLGADIRLLQKPFDPAELARAVRAAIDA
jgi:CheY-like chemotaxis protein